MPRNNARFPQMNSSRTDNDSRPVDPYQNTNWRYINHQNPLGFRTNQVAEASYWLSPTGPGSVLPCQPLDQAANLLTGTTVPYRSAYSSMVHQPPSPSRVADVPEVLGSIGDGASDTLDSSAAQFPSYPDPTTVSPYDQAHWSPSPLENGRPTHVVGGLSYQHAALLPPRAASTASWTSSVSTSIAPSPTVSLEPKPYECAECLESFSGRGELRRHIKHSAAHREGNTPVYRCCCSYKQTRKDNHRRHVRTCKKPTKCSYSCNCGGESNERHEHIVHINACGPGSRSG
ncbi:hypothetical protein F5X98DRAFT_381048 [Xylaria grammica]|nr:hypothetical protein F5X98DRAFT_381048 [Xylaria grammica]